MTLTTQKLDQLAATHKAATRGTWILRQHLYDADMFFVQAPRRRADDPYDIEILGEDRNESLYPVEQARADALTIVALHNAFPELEATIRAQAAQIAAMREALEWYGEQSRLCRLIHREGDPGRKALDDDGGKRASAALKASE